MFGVADYSAMTDYNVVYKYHQGVQCGDYTKFFETCKNQPLTTYLNNMEDDTHGIFHFTFGGVGGTQATTTVATLKKTYGFSDSNIVALAVSAQTFFKYWMAQNTKDWTLHNEVMMGYAFPLNCTEKPWQNNELTVPYLPGEEDGPSCDFIDEFYASETKLDELVTLFVHMDPSLTDSVISRINSLEFEDKSAVMGLIANMFPYDGELAGSGAALDPLFWVAHGSVERLFQKAVFSDIFSDMDYVSGDEFFCSGHDAESAKFWLQGLYFVDESIKAEELTNAELTAILVPTSDQYRDLVNFVYDTADFSYCPDSDAWFV
jgi:hypothetical protein